MVLMRVWSIVLRQFYLMRGSPVRILPLFLWIAIDIVLWGFITRYLEHTFTGGPNMVTQLLGAVLLWDFSTRVMQGVTMVFFEDVWSRNFLNMFATPLTVSEYLGGFVLSSTLSSMLGLLLMIVLAGGLFGLSYLPLGVLIIVFVLILYLFGIALGIFACGVVLRLGPSAEWFIWPIPAVIAPFAGVFYPVTTLPLWMQDISRIFPATYVFEGMRAVLSGAGVVPYFELAAGMLLSLFYVLAAAAFFSLTYRHAVRSGLIARYSAETLD